MREVETALQQEINSLLKARGQRPRLSVDGMARYTPAGLRLPWPAWLAPSSDWLASSPSWDIGCCARHRRAAG